MINRPSTNLISAHLRCSAHGAVEEHAGPVEQLAALCPAEGEGRQRADRAATAAGPSRREARAHIGPTCPSGRVGS